jgi:hypothetical protein
LHEFLHALGDLSDEGVKRTIVIVAHKCFGNDHEATIIARRSLRSLLRDIPVAAMNTPKKVMQIVKEFEKTSEYVV